MLNATITPMNDGSFKIHIFGANSKMGDDEKKCVSKLAGFLEKDPNYIIAKVVEMNEGPLVKFTLK